MNLFFSHLFIPLEHIQARCQARFPTPVRHKEAEGGAWPREKQPNGTNLSRLAGLTHLDSMNNSQKAGQTCPVLALPGVKFSALSAACRVPASCSPARSASNRRSRGSVFR